MATTRKIHVTATDNEFYIRASKILSIVVVVSFVLGFLPSYAISAEGVASPSAEPAVTAPPPPAPEQLSPEQMKLREDWRRSMMQTPTPEKGCFKAEYPKAEWQKVPCGAVRPYPQPPRRGPRPEVIGNNNDVSAEVPMGFISTATGSFDSVTNVTSESGPNCSGSAVNNAYTIQLNTNFFSSTACAGSPNTGCQGWEQFVYENDGSAGYLYIQYWLIQYNATCPAGGGWNQFSFPSSTDIYCWKNNSLGSTSVPNQPITNLGQLRFTGTVSASGDSATFATGSSVYSVTGDNAVNAAAGWTVAEFIVCGNGCGSQATFNSGATIVPRTQVTYGHREAPNCVAQGFTGETNNLSYVTTPLPQSQPGPALFLTESNDSGQTLADVASCAYATTVGDTHLATFHGLLYDFQSSGDFVVAQVDPDFVVQARQVSGAPTWPNASVNKAVATRMGKTKVAICLAPTRLYINGKTAELSDGKTLSLPDGTDIRRRGNVYSIVGQSGDSVRAEVNATWINVSVGLGRWPVKVRGILANVNGNVNQIETRDGTVLTNPFSFEDLYHRYADSWRVSSRESLLSVCGKGKIERGLPKKWFYAKDLDPARYKRARAVCTAAGVKEEALLEACTLDVAVIGNETAARVFVGKPAPVAVGRPGLRR